MAGHEGFDDLEGERPRGAGKQRRAENGEGAEETPKRSPGKKHRGPRGGGDPAARELDELLGQGAGQPKPNTSRESDLETKSPPVGQSSESQAPQAELAPHEAEAVGEEKLNSPDRNELLRREFLIRLRSMYIGLLQSAFLRKEEAGRFQVARDWQIRVEEARSSGRELGVTDEDIDEVRDAVLSEVKESDPEMADFNFADLTVLAEPRGGRRTEETAEKKPKSREEKIAEAEGELRAALRVLHMGVGAGAGLEETGDLFGEAKTKIFSAFGRGWGKEAASRIEEIKAEVMKELGVLPASKRGASKKGGVEAPENGDAIGYELRAALEEYYRFKNMGAVSPELEAHVAEVEDRAWAAWGGSKDRDQKAQERIDDIRWQVRNGHRLKTRYSSLEESEGEDIKRAAGVTGDKKSALDYNVLQNSEGEEMRRAVNVSRAQRKSSGSASVLQPSAGTKSAPVSDEEETNDLMREQARQDRFKEIEKQREAEIRGEMTGPLGISGFDAERGGGAATEAMAATAETAPSPDMEVLKKSLQDARNEYMRYERDHSIFTPEEAVEKLEAYKEARAKYIGADLGRFVSEEVELLKARSEREGGADLYEKVVKGWKWLGEMNLAKTRFGEKGGFISRFLNLRTGVSAALIGLSFVVPAAGGALLVARRGMQGIGTSMGSYELMRRISDARQLKISDDKLAEMPAHEVEKRMFDLAVLAKMGGSWEKIAPTFEKLRTKYEANLAESIKWGLTLEDYSEKQLSRAKEKLRERTKSGRNREWWGRRGPAGLAGIAVAAGVPGQVVNKWLGFWSDEAGLPEMPKDLKWTPASDILRDRAGVPELKYTGAGAREVVERSGEAVTPPSGAGVVERAGEVVAQAAEVAARPEKFVMIFQPGEGPIHEARKAIAKYLAEEGSQNAAFKNLTQAQKLWAEERLWKLTAENLKATGKLKNVFHPGDSLEFSRQHIGKVMAELGEKFNTPQKVAALGENLKNYAGRVNWDRYAVFGGKGLWETAPFNQGIRTVARVSAEAVASGSAERIAEEVAQTAVEHPDVLGPALAGASDGAYAAYRDLDGTWNVEVPGSAVAPEILGGGALEDGEFIDEVRPPVVVGVETFAPAVQEAVVRRVAGLPEKYFNLVKDMKVGDIVRKTFWGATSETRWPWPEGIQPNHADTMRYLRLRDMIRARIESAELKDLASSEKTKIATMSIKDFVRTHLTPMYISRSQ